METTNSFIFQTFRGVLDPSYREDIWSNQDYELKAKTLREKDKLDINDCLWLDNEYLMRKGIWIIKGIDSIEVTKSDRTPLASFEFSPEDFGSSYIKVVKLCLDFLCHQD